MDYDPKLPARDSFYAAFLEAEGHTLTVRELLAITGLPKDQAKIITLQEQELGRIACSVVGDHIVLRLTHKGLSQAKKNDFASRMKHHYVDALAAQSAVNFGALIHSLSGMMQDVRADAKLRGLPHEKHPIIRLFMEQLCCLALSGAMAPDPKDNTYTAAYDVCCFEAGDALPDYMQSEKARQARIIERWAAEVKQQESEGQE